MNEFELCGMYRRLTEDGKKILTEVIRIMESKPKLCEPPAAVTLDEQFAQALFLANGSMC